MGARTTNIIIKNLKNDVENGRIKIDNPTDETYNSIATAIVDSIDTDDTMVIDIANDTGIDLDMLQNLIHIYKPTYIHDIVRYCVFDRTMNNLYYGGYTNFNEDIVGEITDRIVESGEIEDAIVKGVYNAIDGMKEEGLVVPIIIEGDIND